MLPDVRLVALHGRPVARRRLFHPVAQSGNAPDGVLRELEAVEIVDHDHIERCGRRAFISEATDVNIVVVMPPVSQLVNHCGLSVGGEDHRPVGGEQFIESWSSRPQGCSDCGCSTIKSTTLTTRIKMSGTYFRAAAIPSSPSPAWAHRQRRPSPRRGPHHPRWPLPDTGVGGAMARCRIHVEPLPLRLLAGDDPIAAAAQTMVSYRKQAVGVRRQVPVLLVLPDAECVLGLDRILVVPARRSRPTSKPLRKAAASFINPSRWFYY
jgi:hypothetical protein